MTPSLKCYGKIALSILLLICSSISYSQKDVKVYLEGNKQDLTKNSSIEFRSAKIIGFGALHGSAKTEQAEIKILQPLIENGEVKYYFPETDYFTALYFQKYLESGDEELLKDLIFQYKQRVPQEGSLEVLGKWKELNKLYQNHPFKVVGIDKIASYKYSVKCLVELLPENAYLDSLKGLLDNTETNWTSYYKSETKNLLKRFIAHVEVNKQEYQAVSDTSLLNLIVYNFKKTFERTGRAEVQFYNHRLLNLRFDFNRSVQFFRYGVFHLMKGKINGGSSIFNKFIETQTYLEHEVFSIQGFLTNSKVLWNVKRDKEGSYDGFSTKSGFGISDYWLEYYKGIRKLKKLKESDYTMFYLNSSNSPYWIKDNYSLVKIRKLLGRSFWTPEFGKSTANYIDAAILISDSEPNIPIEEILKHKIK